MQPHSVKLTTDFSFKVPLVKRKNVGSTAGPVDCDVTTTPDCLKALYNMTYTPKATDRNTFGIGRCWFQVYSDPWFMICFFSKLLFQHISSIRPRCLLSKLFSYASRTIARTGFHRRRSGAPLIYMTSTLRNYITGSTVLDQMSSVGETGYILQYAMTLVQSQPIMLLQVGGPQTGQYYSFPSESTPR